jgi:hypothetical protein
MKLISSFLTQRKLRVSVEGKMSTPSDIKAGVPQDFFIGILQLLPSKQTL